MKAAKSTITIEASPEKVWTIITTPETIKEFMMGMQAVSEWKLGSELRWIGRHTEKPNDNARGVINTIEKNIRLEYTFYYPGYGYPDDSKFYNVVSYELIPAPKGTHLTVQQGDFSVFKDGDTLMQHSQQFWNQVLSNLKELAEKTP